MSYTFTYGQVLEPLTLPEAKAHLRVDFADDDVYIEQLISTARWKLERQYRRAILSQTMVLGLDWFGMPSRYRDVFSPLSYWPVAGPQYASSSIIELRPPLVSITSVKYYDPSNVLQTFANTNYGFDATSEPGRLYPLPGKSWPATAAVPNAVQVTHISGASDPAQVPENIKQAMRMVLSNFYENREESVIGTRLVALALPDGVDKLMAPYRQPLVR